MKPSLALVVMSFALAGCGTHVALGSARPDLPPTERVAMFTRLRPIARSTTTSDGTLVDSTLTLADHSEVELAGDLLPLVDENSDTARHARASMAARRRGNIASGTTLVLGLGGLLLGGSLTDSVRVSPWTGYTMLGAALFAYVFAHHYRADELDERRSAFATYPVDLGARLNVCAHGLEVIACEMPIEPDSSIEPVPAAPPKPPATPESAPPSKPELADPFGPITPPSASESAPPSKPDL